MIFFKCPAFLLTHVLFFIRKWFIRKQYRTTQKVKKCQCWVFETKKSLLVHMYLKFDFSVYKISYERGSIAARAHASHAEGLRFEPDSMP